MPVWITPKTDWHAETDADGRYTGDWFNASDFNRIKNNLEFLRQFSEYLYTRFTISDLGIDRTPADYFYADEINRMWENLSAINQNTLNRSIGGAPVYSPNGSTMTFSELNRLENSMLDLYILMNNQFSGRRMFSWNFGTQGGL